MGTVLPPPGALLLGADYRALGVARSLGRRGVPVWMLAERSEPLAATSRYVSRRIRWPSGSEGARVEFLCRLAVARGLQGWALIPSGDETAAMAARSYDQLAEHYTHSTPRWDVLKWAYDKRLTYELAARAGVPFPTTLRAAAALNGSAGKLPFPAALKPAIKEECNALTIAKAWRIDDQQELKRRFADARRLLDPELLMLQELIPGNGVTQLSCAALCRDGEPLAVLTAQRTRQYPADFGRASTYVETVDCPDAVEPSLRLVRRMRYTGLIEIEYKRDSRDGLLKLLDMNPRVWGWHTLCGRAGIDFPWLLWQLLCGKAVPPSQARSGVGWLRLTTDTPTAVKQLLARRLSVRDYARSFRRPRESAIFAWDDPLPGIAEVPVLAFVLARRLVHAEAI